MGLSCGVTCVMLRLAVLIQYRSVTDRHTHTDRQTHDDGMYRAKRRAVIMMLKCAINHRNWFRRLDDVSRIYEPSDVVA